MESERKTIQLENGLQIRLKEIHTAPIVSTWIWYRVGSRSERPGGTGLSHWVEHMMFKGTPKFPGSQLDRAISRDGGYWNAMTYLDWTTYFSTTPSGKNDLILQVEADRMQHCTFAPEDVESERTVIISERQGNENSPVFRLMEEVQAAAFRIHPYHHQVIGDMPDLEHITRDQLYGHYQHHYRPENAVLAVAGSFDTDELLARIKELFGQIPDGREGADLPARPEPPQKGERRITVEGPGETAFVYAGYHAPPTTSEDFFILTVLDSLLTGPSSLNMFGGGISNKTSRLYQALVEEEITVSVSGGLQATVDPYLYSIFLTVHPERSPEEVIAVLDQQIDRVHQEQPNPPALERAVKQARALFAYGSESITNQTFWMGFAEMFDSYDWFASYLDRLSKVTPEDIQRVAQEYLRPQNRILGVYLPTGNGQEAQE